MRYGLSGSRPAGGPGMTRRRLTPSSRRSKRGWPLRASAWDPRRPAASVAADLGARGPGPAPVRCLECRADNAEEAGSVRGADEDGDDQDPHELPGNPNSLAVDVDETPYRHAPSAARGVAPIPDPGVSARRSPIHPTGTISSAGNALVWGLWATNPV